MPPREPYDTPEREKEYPEPSMFGMLPAYGFFVRHARVVEFDNVDVGFMKEDQRPAFVIDQVTDIDFHHVKAAKVEGVPVFRLSNVRKITIQQSAHVTDTTLDSAIIKQLP